MPEPTTTGAATVAAAASGITLAMLGVDYYSLLGGMIGALFSTGQADKMTWWRAIASVILTTIVGAVLGTAAVELLEAKSRAVLILGSLISGAGAMGIVSSLIKVVTKRIDAIGDSTGGVK